MLSIKESGLLAWNHSSNAEAVLDGVICSKQLKPIISGRVIHSDAPYRAWLWKSKENSDRQQFFYWWTGIPIYRGRRCHAWCALLPDKLSLRFCWTIFADAISRWNINRFLHDRQCPYLASQKGVEVPAPPSRSGNPTPFLPTWMAANFVFGTVCTFSESPVRFSINLKIHLWFTLSPMKQRQV